MAELFELLHEELIWVQPVFFFIIGACIGSFLNVCIYRIPAEESVIRPASHCRCGTPISWYDNIPILSWFVLKGRARCCGRSFSFRYPLVEALTAVLFVVCWLSLSPGKAFCGMIFCSLMICATAIDIDHLIIPDRFSIGGFAAGVVLALIFPSLHGYSHGFFVLNSINSVITAVVGGLIGSALVLWIGLIAEIILRRDAMGFGDVKLMGAIGAFCGWQGAFFAFFGGAVIGTVGVGLLYLARLIGLVEFPPSGKDIEAMSSEASDPAHDGQEDSAGERQDKFFGREVPFGPWMALAGLLYFLVLEEVVDAYFAQYSMLFFAP